MYDLNHKCIYKRIETDFANHKEYTKEEIDILCENTYRAEILKVFGLDNFNETTINKIVNENFNLCKNSPELYKCMQQLSRSDLEYGFMILYSYDFFSVANECINEYLKNGSIKDENMQQLTELISRSSTEKIEKIVEEKMEEKNV